MGASFGQVLWLPQEAAEESCRRHPCHDVAVLLADVVAVSSAVAATRSRTAKATTIAGLLRRAAPVEVAAVTAWLSGDTLQARLGVGWRTLSKRSGEPAGEPSL